MTNTWKLQDAKARFSEVVRRAKAGKPQRVTLHGQEAVVISDPTRFDVTPKPSKLQTAREFIERSKKYRGILEGIDLSRHSGTVFRDRSRDIFDDNAAEKRKP